MLDGLGAALAKDLRLLARDRTGLAFLTLAPIVVIAVAGFSLAAIYGKGGSLFARYCRDAAQPSALSTAPPSGHSFQNKPLGIIPGYYSG